MSPRQVMSMPLLESRKHAFGWALLAFASALLVAGMATGHASALAAIGPPTGLAASPISPSSVGLHWTPPSGNSGDPVTGYELERANGTLSFGPFLNTTGHVFFSLGNATSFTDSGLKPGASYNYSVFAKFSSPPSAPAGASTPLAPPAAPTGLAAKATTFSRIKLGWTAPAGNGGSPITGYEIERARGDLSFGAFSNSTDNVFFSF